MTALTPRIKRVVGIALTAVAAGLFLLVGFAAFGDPSPGSASVDIRDKVYPGEKPEFSVTLKNTGPVNSVRICPRVGITPASGSATGWTAKVVTTQCIRFLSAELQPVGPSGVVFKVVANIAPSDKDRTVGWTVTVSRDAGTTISDPLPEESANSLKTNVRVLRIELVSITAPAGAADNTVTDGQRSVTVTTVIKNLSTVSHTVTPALSAAAPGKVDTPPTQSAIASQGVKSFGATVSFDAVDEDMTAGFSATAGSPTAAAPLKAAAPVTVQPAATFVCGAFAGPGDTLAATRLVGARPGLSPVFQARLVKTGIQSVVAGVTLTVDPATQKFASTAAGQSFAVGPDDKTLDVTFPGMVVPAGAVRGDFDTAFKFLGKDSNDAAVDVTIEGACNPAPPAPTLPTDTQQPAPKTQVRLDGEVPVITPAITAPTMGQEGVKNGDMLTLSAKIQDGGANTCKVTIESAKLLEFDAAGNFTPNDQAIAMPVTAGVGECNAKSAPTSFTFKITTKEIALQVGAKDIAKNPGLGLSKRIPIDVTVPKILRAFTLTSKSIQVDFTEPIYGSPFLLDWGVPVKANDANAPQLAKTLGRHIVLDFVFQPGTATMKIGLLDELGLDETPMLCYGPGICLVPIPLIGPLTDGAGNALSVPQPVQVTDGLVPGAVSFTRVDGRAATGDAFHTSKDKPDYILGGTVAGHTVDVYEDINRDGTIGGTDVKLGSAKAVGAEVTITPTAALSAGEGRKDVLARPTDAASNVGPVSRAVVNVDRTALKLANATAHRASGLPLSAATIEVTFSETIASGGDSAEDWVLRDAAGNEYVINAVTATNGTTRTLRIGDPTWVDAEGALTLRYLGTAAANPYADAAGNKLGDASVGVTIAN